MPSLNGESLSDKLIQKEQDRNAQIVYEHCLELQKFLTPVMAQTAQLLLKDNLISLLIPK